MRDCHEETGAFLRPRHMRSRATRWPSPAGSLRRERLCHSGGHCRPAPVYLHPMRLVLIVFIGSLEALMRFSVSLALGSRSQLPFEEPKCLGRSTGSGSGIPVVPRSAAGHVRWRCRIRATPRIEKTSSRRPPIRGVPMSATGRTQTDGRTLRFRWKAALGDCERTLGHIGKIQQPSYHGR